jgi:hypothetical protein
MTLLQKVSDLQKQATVERSHFYTGKTLGEVIAVLMMVEALIADVKRRHPGEKLTCPILQSLDMMMGMET